MSKVSLSSCLGSGICFQRSTCFFPGLTHNQHGLPCVALKVCVHGDFSTLGTPMIEGIKYLPFHVRENRESDLIKVSNDRIWDRIKNTQPGLFIFGPSLYRSGLAIRCSSQRWRKSFLLPQMQDRRDLLGWDQQSSVPARLWLHLNILVLVDKLHGRRVELLFLALIIFWPRWKHKTVTANAMDISSF